MNASRRLVVGGLVVVAVGAAVWMGLRRGAFTSGRDSSEAGGVAPRLKWPVGERSIYDLVWTAQTTGSAMPAPAGAGQPQALAMKSEISGEVALEGLGETAGATTVALSFARVGRASFEMRGETVGDAARTARALEDRRAFVRLSPRGEVISISFEEGADAEVRSALRALAVQIQLTMPEHDAAEWDASETVSIGTMRMHYQHEGARLVRRPITIERLDAAPGILDGPQRLEGSATFAVDEGRLSAINDKEDWSYARRAGSDPVIAARLSFQLTLKSRGPCDAAALARRMSDVEGVALADPIADPGRARRRDARLSKNVSVESLLVEIDHFEQGKRPAHDFIVGAGAFLRLHPEAAEALATRFQSHSTSAKARGLILDILSQAGDANAQGTMRAVLASEEARAQPDELGVYLQRFTFVQSPQPESEQFIEQEYQRARHGDQLPAALGAAAALGSVASHLDAIGNHALAQAASDRLREELKGATDPTLQRALLSGLGNAARPENVAAIQPFADSPDPKLRAQVASALRSVDDAGARSTLLGLVGDGELSVAITALSSLGQQSLQPSDWQALADLAANGSTNVSSDGKMVELIRDHRRDAGQQGDAILRSLLQRNHGSENDIGSLISQLLSAPPG